MNFVTFPVAATNIFPAANGKNGSQLVTERNLRSRETVGTYMSVTYEIGPSYTHSEDDFSVSLLTNDGGEVISDSILKISPGRAIINGHFVEVLTPMQIDLAQANAELQASSQPLLKGNLSIGIRAFYATEETVSGSILTEDENDMYLGFQLVVLPNSEFMTPIDTPTDSSKVTAHLLLATFNVVNNKITSIKNSSYKVQHIPAGRISQLDAQLVDSYIKKTGLNSKKIYAFAGRGVDPSTNLDTWEDVTDSLMIWDRVPGTPTTEVPIYNESQFVTIGDDVDLALVHKKIDGYMDSSGNDLYYPPHLLKIPSADYEENTPGVVTKSYTQNIKQLQTKINNLRDFPNGKQVCYLETKTSETVLPAIYRSSTKLNVGDYVVVKSDYTAYDGSEAATVPSTMYLVLPGLVTEIIYWASSNAGEEPEKFLDRVGKTISISGVEIGTLIDNSEPDTTTPDEYPQFFNEDNPIRGLVCTTAVDSGGKTYVSKVQDYFRYRYIYRPEGATKDTFKDYYYAVKTAGPYTWSDFVSLTGVMQLATEDYVGGFLNVSTDNRDYGYVYLDDTGRLRLLDYGLLRSGTLAYQLSEDITFPTSLTTSEIQSYLNEYVNERIAFPKSEELSASNPNLIHLYITLPEEESAATINICDIDSRFSTAVCLHILGSANSNTTINIYDCEKIKIDNNIEGTPVINVCRSGLYYDAYVLNYIRTCNRTLDADSTFTGILDMSLWYCMYDDSDPNLVVDNMTVSEIDAPVIPQSIDYWATRNGQANDNRYFTALKSIKFSTNGTIVECGMLIADDSTNNVSASDEFTPDEGNKIILGSFTLPQGSGLTYPSACLTSQLKVTGTFVSAYYANVDEEWYVTDNSFSAVTQAYDEITGAETISGSIAIHATTTKIPYSVSATAIPAWDTGTYHLFYGGTTA